MARILCFTGNAGRSSGNDNVALADRPAMVLAEIIDEPLTVLNDASSVSPRPLQLRLAHFQPELAERAAELLEEAGW